METYSLFELNQYIRQVIALNFEELIRVRCELSDANESRGHWYLSLVEKGRDGNIIAQSQAVIWRGTAAFLKRKLDRDLHSILQPGMEVALDIKVDFHERYGLKYIVEDIDASYTLGQLAIQRQAIIDSLRARQLLDKNSRLSLPPVFQRLAVISSETAAGWADFRETIAENEFHYAFTTALFPASMQGDRVETEVTAQLEAIAQASEQYDAVAIIRGGGSKLDLAGFDSEKIGESIAAHPLPVFTGIGHETDETVSDLVAWRSLKTPTALAGFFIEMNQRFEAEILDLGLRIRDNSQRFLQREGVQLDRIQQLVSMQSDQLISRETDRLQQLKEQLTLLVRYSLQQEKQLVAGFESLFRSVHPRKTLKRGYSLTFRDRKAVRSVDDLKTGDILQTILVDGQIESRIELLEKTELNEENDL